MRRRLSDGLLARVPMASDAALAACLVIVAVLSGIYVETTRPDTIEPSQWWHWLLLVTPPAAVALRRASPVFATTAAAVAQGAIWVSGLPDVLLPMLVLLYSAASDDDQRGPTVALVTGTALTALTGIGTQIADDVTPDRLPLIALTFGTAIILGLQAARQRRTAAELATEVATARLQGEHERVEAVAAERSRIARELHDIIGHTLATIAVRAEAADRVGKRRPEAVQDAVVAIAGAARSALDETRRVLAGLRTSTDVELLPPPDLASIEGLVDDLVDAGVAATFRSTGCDAHCPPAVVVSGAHRIVQESLTNAVKHGGPEVTVAVELTCSPDGLALAVIDDGRAGPTPGSSGMGLAGMAERAEVLGGTFSAGPQPEGGFAVRATLPLEVPG